MSHPLFINFHFDFSGIVWAGLNMLLLIASSAMFIITLIISFAIASRNKTKPAAEPVIALVEGSLLMMLASGGAMLYHPLLKHDYNTRKMLDGIAIPYVIIFIVIGTIVCVWQWKSIKAKKYKQ